MCAKYYDRNFKQSKPKTVWRLTHNNNPNVLFMRHRQTWQNQICGVWSGSSQFADWIYFLDLNDLKLTTQQPLNSKWIRLIDKNGKFL